MASDTSPLESGVSTSEGMLTIALCVVGIALEAFAATLQSNLTTHPQVTWLAVTSLVVGAAVQVLSVLGYSKNRASLKANTTVAAIAAGIPVVITAVSNAFLKNLPPKVQEQAAVAAATAALVASKDAGPAATAAARSAVAKDMKASPP